MALAPGDEVRSSGAGTYKEKYPEWSWAFEDPEVGYWLDRAVRESFGAEELAGRIRETAWWKQKTNAERAWLKTLATNPADANKLIWDYDAASRYVKMSAAYGQPFTFDSAMRQVQRVTTGKATPDELEEELRRQAKAMYPHLAQQLDAGSTVDDVFSAYRGMASNVLGVNAETINLSDPKWQAALQFTDKAGARRVATTDEWMTMLRTDDKYGYDKTSTARGEAAEFAAGIGKMFGNFG